MSVLLIGFLLHFRSALIPILTLPLAVLISFIPFYYMGIGMNIMRVYLHDLLWDQNKRGFCQRIGRYLDIGGNREVPRQDVRRIA